MAEIEAGVPAEFPHSPDHVPTYANVTMAKEVSGAVFLEFGFLDPTFLTQELVDQLQQQERAVEVKLLSRLVLSKQTARQLFGQLQSLLGVLQ